MVISARDAARFGQLYLQGGVWKDRQLVPAEWVAQSTSVQNPGPGGSTGQYGYQWWIRPYAVNAFGPTVPLMGQNSTTPTTPLGPGASTSLWCRSWSW